MRANQLSPELCFVIHGTGGSARLPVVLSPGVYLLTVINPSKVTAMPWKAKDAAKHTKKATTPAKKEKFAKTANAVLKKTGDEGKAVRIANAAVKKGARKR